MQLLAVKSALDGHLDKKFKETQVEQCMLELSSYNDTKHCEEINEGNLQSILKNKLSMQYFK